MLIYYNICYIKKLQQKISHSKDDNEENDILKKIKDYALITQEISSIKQKETKLKSKDNLSLVHTENNKYRNRNQIIEEFFCCSIYNSIVAMFLKLS